MEVIEHKLDIDPAYNLLLLFLIDLNLLITCLKVISSRC
jgi:hypothetical protein